MDFHNPPSETLKEKTGIKKQVSKPRPSTDDFQSEKEWHSGVNRKDNGVWNWDIQNDHILFSSCWKSILGYSDEEVGSTSAAWHSLINPDDLPRVKESMDRQLAGENAIFVCDYRIRCKNGAYKWVLDTGKVTHRGENQSPIHFAGAIKDLSKDSIQEENLVESDARFRAFFEHASIGVALMESKTGRFIQINQAFCDLLGYSFDEILKTDFQKITHPEDMQADLDNMRLLLDGKVRSFTMEKRYIRRDGSIIWVNLTVSGIWEVGAEPDFHLAIVEDITERKNAEKALLISESTWRSFFETCPFGISLRKLDGELIDVNPAYMAQIGYTREELMRKHYLEITPTKWHEGNAQFDANMKSSRQPSFYEKELIRKDGVVYPVSLTGWSIRDENGNPNILGVFVQDISESKLAEKALQESELKFRSLYESMVELSVIHEIVFDSSGKPVDYRILDCNPSFERITGIQREKAIGALASGLYGTGEPPYFGIYLKVAQSGIPVSFETEFAPMLKTFRISVFSPGKNKFVTIATDITDRKQTERKLEESEARYRGLFDDSPVSIWEEDFSGVKKYLDDLRLQGVTNFHRYFSENPESLLQCASLVKIIDVNKATSILMGAEEKNDLLKSLQDVLLLEGIQGLSDEMISVAEGKKRFEWEGKQRRLDGSLVDIHLEWSVVPGHEFDLSRVLVSITDISKLKLTEAALQKSNAQLLKFASQVPGVLFQFIKKPDGSYGIPFSTGKIREIFDTSPEDVRDSLDPIMKSIHPDDVPLMKEAIEYSYTNLTHIHFEFRVIQPDKTIQWMLAQSIPEKMEDGSVVWSGFLTDITERKVAEEKLSDSEAQFRLLVETSIEGIWSMDKDHRTTFVNNAMANMLGYEPADILGKRVEDFFFEEDLKNPEDLMQERHTGKDSIYERRFRRYNGQELWTLVSARELTDDTGNFSGSFAMFTDITSRKQTEKSLRESERQLSTLISNLIGFAYRCKNDNNWTMEFVSNGCLMVTGYSPEDLINNQILAYNDLIHPQDREMVWDEIRKALESKAPFQIEYRITKQDGSEKWVWEQGRGYFVDDELVALEGFITDVTDRKLAERALKNSEEKYRNLSFDLEKRVQRRTAEIEAIRQRLQLATQVANLGVWDWNIITGELFWDDQVFEIYGLSKSEFKVSVESFMSIVYPEDVALLIKYIQEAFEGRSSGKFEYRIMHNDKTLTYVRVHGTILLDESGKPDHVIGVVQDITQDKLSEIAMRESKSRLEMINRELETFAYSVSHDLRAPIRRIDSWTSILSEEYSAVLDSQAQVYLDRVQVEAESMNNLINDLLELAKVTGSEIHVQVISLSDLARQILDNLRSESPERKADIKIQPDIFVLGDERLIKIAMTNLLENAWKYSSKKENTLIEFGAQKNSDGLVYFVRDNGAGFNMEYAGKLFNAFQRLHSASEFSGTGVGLATVQRIIRRHNGRIWAESQDGIGATFYFTIQTTPD